MGQKKHKHARRTVAFYKLHHGFKEPFKVRDEGLRRRRRLRTRARRLASLASSSSFSPQRQTLPFSQQPP
jgi:hypothetical protein